MSTFDEKAQDWDDDERRERARVVAGLIRQHVPLSPSMRIIDIGAATGLLGLELAPEVAAVVLAEASSGMHRVTLEKLARGGAPNVEAVQWDLPGDPPPGSPFDLAVSVMVLHHVADLRAALRSIHELLAPGGSIALVDLDAEDGSFHEDPEESVHHHGFERAALKREAASSGFIELRVRTAYELDRDGRSYPLFLLTGRRR